MGWANRKRKTRQQLSIGSQIASPRALARFSLVFELLQKPRHVFAQRLHCLNAFFILLDIADLAANADVPVRRAGHDHLADEKEVVQGVEGMDRSRLVSST